MKKYCCFTKKWKKKLLGEYMKMFAFSAKEHAARLEKVVPKLCCKLESPKDLSNYWCLLLLPPLPTLWWMWSGVWLGNRDPFKSSPGDSIGYQSSGTTGWVGPRSGDPAGAHRFLQGPFLSGPDPVLLSHSDPPVIKSAPEPQLRAVR